MWLASCVACSHQGCCTLLGCSCRRLHAGTHLCICTAPRSAALHFLLHLCVCFQADFWLMALLANAAMCKYINLKEWCNLRKLFLLLLIFVMVSLLLLLSPLLLLLLLLMRHCCRFWWHWPASRPHPQQPSCSCTMMPAYHCWTPWPQQSPAALPAY
jgi:hypothetical protein